MYIEEYDENDIITDELILQVIKQMPHLALINRYYIERLKLLAIKF
jgi:hypothetical protein